MNDFFMEINEDLNISFFICEGEKIFEEEQQEIYLFGHIIKREESLKEIVTNYKENRTISENVNGNYVLVLNDKYRKEIRVIPDKMGGHKNIYYIKYKNKYYISTSVKGFEKIGFNKKFNYAVLDEFIYNGVIKTKDTLICGMYKLLVDEYLFFDKNCAETRKRKVNNDLLPSISVSELYEYEKNIIEDYIEECGSKAGNINLALSGGYDSNLILHIARQFKKYDISAYTCGGNRGADETTEAENICKIYGDVSLNTCFVDENILNEMSEIAERLEGALYERGIYMQYALAKKLFHNGVRFMVLGECADQIFNINYYRNGSKQFLMNYRDNPKELGTMLVLKKSVLTLSSFGITGLYPFIDNRMIKIGQTTAEYNETSKKFQKYMCGEFLADEVKTIIGKKPGSTSLAALFADEESENKFIQYVQKTNEFYDPDFRISFKYGERESILDYYLCLEYLKCFKQKFCDQDDR